MITTISRAKVMTDVNNKILENLGRDVEAHQARMRQVSEGLLGDIDRVRQGLRANDPKMLGYVDAMKKLPPRQGMDSIYNRAYSVCQVSLKMLEQDPEMSACVREAIQVFMTHIESDMPAEELKNLVSNLIMSRTLGR